MSKYHPIDVRHPANRQYQNRNFLLDPPSQTPQTRSRLRGSSTRTTEAAATVEPTSASSGPRPSQHRWASKPVAPWGASGTTSGVPAATRERRGSGLAGFIRSLFIIIVIGVIVATQTDLLDDVILQLRIWAYELGLPFRF